MGFEGSSSAYEDVGSDKIEEPLLDKSELIGRGYQTQPDTVLSLPSTPEAPPVFGYNVGVRPYQDLIFSIIFLLLILISASFGIYGVFHSNPDYQRMDLAHYDPTDGCSIPASIQLDPLQWKILHLLTPRPLKHAVLKSMAPGTHPIWITLGLTLAFSGPFAWGLLYLLRVYTMELVYATLPFLVLLPIALDLTGLILCLRSRECRAEFDSPVQFILFSIILLMCGLVAYMIYANWDRIGMTIRVVKTSAEALHHNLMLLVVLPSLSVALVLFCSPLFVLIGFAQTNGKLVINPEMVDHPTRQCAPFTDTPCCVWEPAAWVPPYQYLTGFAVLWAAMIMAQIQVFTISGTISQWYFAQAGASSVNATRRALSVAFGPAFGTACLAGLVVAIVRVIQEAMNNARNDNGAVSMFLRACLQCILKAVEFFTRFTSNFAAITGESFYASAIMTYDLLKRNLLSTVLVEVISDRLLAMVTFVLSLAYALLVYGVLSLSTDLQRDQKLITAILSWLIVCFVLILFDRVLSSIIDTVYICYAMDKDQGVASKSAVHEVLVLLPASRDENPSLAVPRGH